MKVADKGLRFANYLIDKIGFVLVVILHAFILDGLLHLIPENGSPLLGLYSLFLYFGYHFVFEYYFGKTPGKFITNTVVVDVDGKKPNVMSLVIRNLSRLIPFDNLSFLFGKDGWHDNISGTQVMQDSNVI
jgi:uncharacterized RDD family membrane protein YckC